MRKSLAISLSSQRWLPYKTRRSIIKRLHPQMLRNFAFEAEFFGLKFRGNIVNYIDRLIYFCGGHEKYMLTLLQDYIARLAPQIRHRPVFIDVGANAGNHSLFMSRIADVQAFEPFARVRTQFEENLARNHITNVQVHPFGLSDSDAVLPFYSGPDTNLGAASFTQGHKQDNYYLGDMQLRRGDDVLAALTLQHADIIKADVEGFEKNVLLGLNETLARHRPLCIVEFSPSTRETIADEAAFKALFPPDYHFYYFAVGKLDSGRYQLALYHYALTPKIQDVIACPNERLACLLGS